MARLRLEKRLTQQELADKAGLDRSTVRRIERAETNVLEVVDNLAKALNVPAKELL